MKPKAAYLIVSPDQVQPGDIYKFIPANGAEPLYATVLSVHHNLVQVQRGSATPVFTPIAPPMGQVIFGRKIETTGDES